MCQERHSISSERRYQCGAAHGITLAGAHDPRQRTRISGRGFIYGGCAGRGLANGAECGRRRVWRSSGAAHWLWGGRCGSVRDPAVIEEFVAINGGDPLRNPRVLEGLTAPVLKSCHDLQPASEAGLRRNFIYADHCRRWEGQYGSQTTLIRDERILVGFLVHRNEKGGLPPTEARHAFEVLAPHVLAAVKMQMALESQGAKLMAGALETVRAAAFVCDSFGLVRSLTPAAEAAVCRGPLRLKAGKLSVSSGGCACSGSGDPGGGERDCEPLRARTQYADRARRRRTRAVRSG